MIYKACCNCRQILLFTLFSKRKKSTDGMDYRCRRCNHSLYASRKHLRVQVKEVDSKTCWRCRKDLPAHRFHRARSSSDGLQGICRSCRQVIDRYRAEKVDVRYKATALQSRKRGLEFSLSLEDFTRLLSDARCHYCGGSLPDVGSGLDRIDNSTGYRIDNVVTCCTVCNLTRGDRFTFKEMEKLGSLISKFRESRPGLSGYSTRMVKP